jgi:hypothetical protein
LLILSDRAASLDPDPAARGGFLLIANSFTDGKQR